MERSIYFIALLPDPFTRAAIKEFKTAALQHFGSGHALRSPAHITLEPPFKWYHDQVALLQDALDNFVKSQTTFTVALRDFAAFVPRVIYVDVVENEKLNQLQATLKNHLRSSLQLISDRPDLPFHPHVTVAFKDLKKAVFPQAWSYFSHLEYHSNFLADRISLLKHNGKHWEVINDFIFKGEV